MIAFEYSCNAKMLKEMEEVWESTDKDIEGKENMFKSVYLQQLH